ncbi:hypothetical protein D3C79_1003200 [compost metagenome]
MIRRRERRVGCGDQSPIANSHLLQHIAIFIHFQRHRVLDSRILALALVVVGDDFARVGEENGVAIRATGLQQADGEVLFHHGVGVT